MTTEAVIIAGYKLTIPNNIDDIESLKEIFKRDYDNLNDDNRLIFINRDYDSIDIEDYGIYICQQWVVLPQSNIATKSDILKVINTMAEPMPECYKPLLKKMNIKVSDFNIFTDYCDVDRGISSLTGLIY